MNAIDLLRNDHRRLLSLIRRVASEWSNSKQTSKSRRLERLQRELTLHREMEEEVLYPSLETFAEVQELVSASRDQLESIERMASRIPAAPSEQESLAQLKTAFENHISISRSLFEEAPRLLDDSTLLHMLYKMDQIEAHQSEIDSLIRPVIRFG